MRAIFLSYRRDDTEGEAGRLFDDLIHAFGTNKVFMDVTGIEPGRDFRKVIDQNVSSCGVLLAMIGKGWIDAKDETGRRRLEDPMDFVRLETASALKRDIPVIPVLVHGGRMPRPDQLPEDLKDLAYRNAVELTHTRWDSDVQLLINALRPHVGDESSQVVPTMTEPMSVQPAVKSTPPALKETGEGGTSSVASTRPPKKSWHIMLMAAVAAIVITAGVVGMYEYKKAEEAKRKSGAPDQPPSKSTDKTVPSAKPPAAKDNVTSAGQGEVKPKTVPRLRVVDVSLLSSPQEFKGPCPAAVSFPGKITVAGSPGQIRYQFVNERGQASDEDSLQFDSVGTRYVQTTRMIGTKGRTEIYTGWEELRILSPQQHSARAPLRVECVANQFRNLRRLDETGNSLSFTVDYSYSGDNGLENVRAYGLPIQQDGRIVSRTTSGPVAIDQGEGTLTIRIVESARGRSGPATYESAQVRVCMDRTPMGSSSPGAAQPKAEPFYCENFPYQKTWVFVAPASARPAPASPAPAASSGVAGAKGGRTAAPSSQNVVQYVQADRRGEEIEVTVNYTYNGDHGGGVRIDAVPYQRDGSTVPGVDLYLSKQVGVGEGTVLIRWQLGQSFSGTYDVSWVKVCMGVPKEKSFYCKDFGINPMRLSKP